MNNIIVFGANGMLGRYVSTYFHQHGFYVNRITRNNYDLTKITSFEIENELKKFNNPIVINCAGAIIQKIDTYGIDKMIEINSVFPWKLAKVCNKENIKLIHVTTDCVYSGLKGKYIESDIADDQNIYGKSKSIGEPTSVTVIRTSIIGEELEGKKSFIEWVKSEKGKTVNGYVRNIWNGVTCLQFAKICHKIITENLFWKGIRHFYSPDSMSKYEMVKTVSNIYDLDINVQEKQLPKQLCDRTLYSNYDISEYNIPSIKDQILELKQFNLTQS
jgi:dTDP-4-dehydrorhamnose reductase